MSEKDFQHLLDSLSNHPMVLAASPQRRLPLTVAVGSGDLELVEYLLEQGLDPNERNEDGSTALSEVSDSQICEALLQAGALVSEEQPEHGRTSLHYSSMLGQVEILRQLLDSGGATTALSGYDSMNYTPLHHAATKNKTEVVLLLLEAGAKPNLAKRACRTPTQLAVTPYTMDSLKALLAYGGLLGDDDVRHARATYGENFAEEVSRICDSSKVSQG